jgi:transcription termination factor Rho
MSSDQEMLETPDTGSHEAAVAPAPVAAAEAPQAPAAAEAAPAEEKPVRKTRRRRTTKKAEAAADDSANATGEDRPAKASATVDDDAARSDAAESGHQAEGGEAVAQNAADVAPGRAVRRRTTRKRTVRKDDAPSEEATGDAADDREADAADSSDEHVHRTERGHQDDSREHTGRDDREYHDHRNNRQRNQRRNNDQNRGRNNRNNNNDRHQRHQRRKHQGRNNTPMEPQVKREDLAKLKVAELREKATELDVPFKGLLKADLVEAVYQALAKKEGFQEVCGILDIMQDGYGFLRTNGYLPGEHDVYVAANVIRRNGLRKGDMVVGQSRPARDNEKFGALQRIASVNGMPLEELGKRVRFADLTPVFPDERLVMEHGRSDITARVIDLAAPIGKGQRGLIVSPPKAGKTTILKDIAASITANNPECHLMCLLVDERPEEVTDMQRSVRGEVIASTFDMPAENHIHAAEMVIERAKRLVENGEDVVILLDSITRLARAYNLAQPASGRILSGGVDSTALYPPKRFFGAARNIEHGGSLTILASALIDTGSKMDEVIFEEFKGTGNMELRLDRNLADRRIYPAIDPVASGTRKEDLLLDPQEAPLIWAVRRILANLNNTERAMDMLVKSLKQTDSNRDFLLRTAKKAQGRRMGEIKEF